MRLLGKEVLERHGYAVLTAMTGEEATGIARDTPLSLVLMDLSLPGIDGLETTRRLKERQPQLPIIVVSGYASESDEQQAIDAGADGYIAKPYKAPELLARIANLLG
jgi:DNA-binding response OmpR family regulator